MTCTNLIISVEIKYLILQQNGLMSSSEWPVNFPPREGGRGQKILYPSPLLFRINYRRTITYYRVITVKDSDE